MKLPSDPKLYLKQSPSDVSFFIDFSRYEGDEGIFNGLVPNVLR